MTSLTITLPDTVFSTLRRTPIEFVEEMRIEAACQKQRTTGSGLRLTKIMKFDSCVKIVH